MVPVRGGVVTVGGFRRTGWVLRFVPAPDPKLPVEELPDVLVPRRTRVGDETAPSRPEVRRVVAPSTPGIVRPVPDGEPLKLLPGLAGLDPLPRGTALRVSPPATPG